MLKFQRNESRLKFERNETKRNEGNQKKRKTLTKNEEKRKEKIRLPPLSPHEHSVLLARKVFHGRMDLDRSIDSAVPNADLDKHEFHIIHYSGNNTICARQQV